MKKLFTLFCLLTYSFIGYGQTTYFSQDFLANATISSYVGVPASTNQFSEIPTVAGITNTINTGRYRIAKSGTAAVNYRFGRGVDFASEPKSMYCQFNFGVVTAPVVTKNNAIVLSLGGSGIVDGTTVPTAANTYAKLNFNLIAGSLSFQVNDGTTSSTNFTGNQDVTFVMNNTGVTFTYIAPNGTNETLGNDLFDVWVGTTKVFNDRPVTTATQSIKRFRFDVTLDAAAANAPTISFDNFLMRDVTGSLLVNTASATPDSMLVKYSGTGAVKNVGLGITPTNKLEIKSDTLNKSGLRFTNLKSISPTGLANGKVLTVSPSGDVILVNSVSSSIPDSMVVKFTGTGVTKNVGIGIIPTTKFEIKSDTNNTSGLKFTNLKSTSTVKSSNGKGLSVDGAGNVILVNVESAGGSTIPDSMIVRFYGTGLTKNVGIGTTTPNNKLEINGTGSGLRFTNLNSTNSVSTWAGKVLSVDANGDVVLVKDSVGTTSAVTSVWTSIANNRIQNANTGAVVIGALNTTALPGNYKLYVQSGILTEEVKIAAEGSLDWADYVFANNYKLRSLSEVENFVKINKHLPGVPSAEEVSKNGINVAKMEAKLLEKIEELTLYMIDMKKENQQLKNRLRRLENKK